MNRPFANGSALTLALSLREREERRKRAEHSKRLFAEPTAEWFSLSLRERLG